ncbi:MAG: type 4a pilus biogenesis protein PilO [Candidatus Omnitrophota bacterium]
MRSQITSIFSLNSQRMKLNRDITAAKTEIAQINRLKEQYKNLEESINQGQKWFISEEEIPSLLENVSSIANNTDVKIMQIKPLQKRQIDVAGKSQDFSPLSIYIIAQAGYHQLGRFLNQLHDNKVFMKTSELDILPDAKNYLRHNIKLVLTVFLVKK